MTSQAMTHVIQVNIDRVVSEGKTPPLLETKGY